jgi:hypothetical protein
MQNVLQPLPERRCLPLSDFLAALFQAIAEEGVRFCVLRNYEGFPDRNVGSDVDLLICPSDLRRVVRALSLVCGIKIVGYVERHYVAHLFVEGVSPAPGIRALGVDFIWNLNWKGISFLKTDTVLQEAIPRQAGNLNFLVPSANHEAIISLLSSLLVGGWVKEKYFPKVQETFACSRSETIAALLPAFGQINAMRLVDSAIGGDRGKMRGCVKSLRISLILRFFARRPLRGVIGVARYYTRELAVRCTPETIESVRISGPDGCRKTTIIDGLIPLLRYSAKTVERRHLWRQLMSGREPLEGSTSADLDSELRGGYSVSLARVVLWLLEERLSQFKKKDNLTLHIIDDCSYDPLIDARRCSDRTQGWFARLAVRLFPSPDLWVLLDPTVGGLQFGDGEVPTAAALRQLEAYRCFIKTRKRFVIVDDSQPADSVIEHVYAAIVNVLAQRAESKLGKRFSHFITDDKREAAH